VNWSTRSKAASASSMSCVCSRCSNMSRTPGVFCRGCVRLLKPGGRLCVGVPNNDGYLGVQRIEDASLNLPPHHATRWGLRTLRMWAAHPLRPRLQCEPSRGGMPVLLCAARHPSRLRRAGPSCAPPLRTCRARTRWSAPIRSGTRLCLITGSRRPRTAPRPRQVRPYIAVETLPGLQKGPPADDFQRTSAKACRA
jgi:hypothetical protein